MANRPLTSRLRKAAGELLRAAAAPPSESILRAAASLLPATADAEGRTVRAVIASETPLVDLVWDGLDVVRVQNVLLADGMVIRRKSVPLLDTHNRWTQQAVLGSVRDVRPAAGVVEGTLHFSSVTVADEAFTRVREGHLTDISVGAAVLSFVRIDPGKTKTVRGREYTAPADMPLRIVTRWELNEASLCARGIDPSAVTRQGKEAAMNFEQWLIERGYQPAELTDQDRETLQRAWRHDLQRTPATPPAEPPANPPANPPAEPPAVRRTAQPPAGAAGDLDVRPDENGVIRYESIAAAVGQAVGQAQRDELQRQQAIRDLAAPDVPEEVITRCITEGHTVERASREILRHLRENRSQPVAPAVHVHGAGDITRAAVTAGLCMAEGLSDEPLQRAFDEPTLDIADRRCRSMTMMDIARASLTLARRDVPHDRDEMLRAAFTTNDLDLIFTTSANLFVMDGFQSAPQTWREWCRVVSASDFKTHTGIRFAHSGRLQQVEGASGEIKHGRLIEEGEYYSVGTYAELLAITRQHFIDDSRGLLQDTARLMGDEAMQTLSDLAYTALLANATLRDSVAMIHATHNNLNTDTDLTDENLSAAKRLFRQQTGPDKRRLNRPAQVMLIPDELERVADKLLTSEYMIGYGGGNNTTAGERNVHYQTLRKVVESRLSDTTFHASASSTSWYLALSSMLGAYAMAFLNGKQTPTVTRFAPPADYVAGGVIYQIYIDAGCSGMEYRAIQRNDA